MLTTAWRAIVAYLIAIWEFRYFWMSLVKAELQRRYRRSVLGLGWSLLQPISMTIVLALVYRRLFHMNFWEFAPLLLTGLAFWNYISSMVLMGCQSLLSAECYIRQQSVPLAIFPLRTVLTVGFHFMISLALALVFVFAVQGPQPILPMLTLVPTLVLLFLFGWSLAVLAGFSHVYFPDTQHLAEVGLQTLMFLTPIMYPPSMLQGGRLGIILSYNPLALLLQMIRDPILTGQVPPLNTVALAVAFVFTAMGCATLMVARLERRLIFAM